MEGSSKQLANEEIHVSDELHVLTFYW